MAGPRRDLGRLPRELTELARDRTRGAHEIATRALAALIRERRRAAAHPSLGPGLRMLEIARRLRRLQPGMAPFPDWAADWARMARTTPASARRRAADRWMTRRRAQLRAEPRRVASAVRTRLPPGARILTISRSGTLRTALAALPVDRRPRQVWALESLPGGEGRAFARELRHEGLHARTVADARAGAVLNAVDLVLIGADAIEPDGTVIHKVGTLRLARAAARRRVPVFVVAGRSKRLRVGRVPRRLPALFERVPARWITGYWTDDPSRDAGERSGPARSDTLTGARSIVPGTRRARRRSKATIERVGPDAFDSERFSRRGVWAVDFAADWCPFCREFEPRFEGLAAGGFDHLVVADLTSLENPLWERFSIEIVPSVIVFQDGRPILRVDGVAGEGLDDAALARVRAAVRPSAPGRPRAP